MTRQRTIAACHAAANQPFDWDAWNADFNARMARLEQAIEQDAEAGRAFVRAAETMARDVRGMMGEV